MPTIAMPELHQIRRAERRDSCHELEPVAVNMPQDRLLFAIEQINHTFHLDSCRLSGTAREKLSDLKKRRVADIGIWQLIAAYLLCKRPYIAIGTFGVSESRDPSTSIWCLTQHAVDE
jgi:hypothetical protein